MSLQDLFASDIPGPSLGVFKFSQKPDVSTGSTRWSKVLIHLFPPVFHNATVTQVARESVEYSEVVGKAMLVQRLGISFWRPVTTEPPMI